MKQIEIDSLKGFAIIGVIFTHMDFKGRFEPSTLIFIDYIQIIFGWCVIAFFFSSGLLAKSIQKKDKFIEFLKKRFKRLIIPCIIFTLTYKLIIIVLYYSGYFTWDNPIPDNKLLLLSPVGPQFYFLPYLFIMQVSISFLEFYLSRKTLLLLASVLFSILFFIISPPQLSHGGAGNLVPIYIYAYILGLFLATQKSIFNIETYIKLTLLIAFILFYINFKFVILVQLYVPILLWLVLKKFTFFSMSFNRLSIGKYSGAIYVWHAPIVLPFVSIVCVKLFGGGIFVIIPILVLTILISSFFGKLTERYAFLSAWRF